MFVWVECDAWSSGETDGMLQLVTKKTYEMYISVFGKKTLKAPR